MVQIMSWGAHKFKGGSNYLIFKVQGFKLKGQVKITLNSLDLYDIEFINSKGKVIKTVEGIYFDQLIETIDNEVETNGGQYTSEQEKIIRRGFKF